MSVDLAPVVEVRAGLKDGVIAADMDRTEIVDRVMRRGQLVLLKGVFADAAATKVRTAVADWGREV